MAKFMAGYSILCLLALLVSYTLASPIKVDTKTRQFVDDQGKWPQSYNNSVDVSPFLGFAHLFHGVNVVRIWQKCRCPIFKT